MKHEINWSNLIIEKGVFDPLGLWRVGDRLIGQLLSPFTTVVTHRPARYFSMYCWILYFLNKKTFNNDKSFWKWFYNFESVFLCAIRIHEPHNYKHFQGQIGTGTAKTNVARIEKGSMQIGKLEKSNNGWETNYKNAMYDFFLIETDFGITSKVKLTKRGEALAKSYQKSIEESEFYKNINDENIDYAVVKDLSKYSCPCLLYYNPSNNSSNEFFEKEVKVIISNMLSKFNLVGYENIEGLDNILSSTYLMLNCLIKMNKNSVAFSKQGWRRVLSTGLFDNQAPYKAPEKSKQLFHHWEIYNLDSIFIYSLETGLCGFLEFLHKNMGYLPVSRFNILADVFDTVCGQFDFFKKHFLLNDIGTTLNNLASLDPEEQLYIEEEIIEKILNHNAEQNIVCGFLLYIYVQALYYAKFIDNEYKETINFYIDHSEIDGWELSLQKTMEIIFDSSHKNIKDFFLKEYLKKWIVDRQLDTRRTRGKDVAWFSYNNETKSYNWEAAYQSRLYRAPRSEILMTFLLNLNIVEYQDGQWLPGHNIKYLERFIN